MVAVDADDVSFLGGLNLYGGFWRRVIRDLQGVPISVSGREGRIPGQFVRHQTLAWLLSDELRFDARGNPVSFVAWCQFGGMDLDPAWWRECLLSGQIPTRLRREDM
jgi:hypothetical protein